MKLINPETNEEYEVVKEIGAGDGSGKNFIYEVKPLDTWPKVGKSVYLISDNGNCFQFPWQENSIHPITGIYKSLKAAEYAAERIRSLQEAERVLVEYDKTPGDKILVSYWLPKKYLKAWQELVDKD